MTKKKSEDIKKKSEKIDKKIEKISKTFPKSAKYSIAAITSLVVLGGLMMIPINARTTVSRVLDGTGFHKQAVAVDNVYSENNLVSLLSSVDKSSDKSCKSLWNDIKKTSHKLEASSSITNITLEPLNKNFKEDLYLSLTSKQNVNLKDLAAAVDYQLELNLNSKIIDEKYPKIKVDVKASSIINSDKGYIKLDKAEAQLDGLKTSIAFDGWYSSDSFGLKDNQKTAAKNISNEIIKLTDFKGSDILSDKTGELLTLTACQSFKSADVKGVEPVTLGSGEYKKTTELREVEVEFEGVTDKFIKSLASAGESAVSDDVLKSFIKSKYNNLVDIAKNVNEFAPETSDSIPSQDDYNKDIDKGFKQAQKEYNKGEVIKSLEFLQSTMKDAKESGVKVETTTKIYLKPGTNKVVAYKTSTNITINEEFKKLAKEELNEKSYNVIKDGLTLSITVYDMKKNDEVESIKTPSGTKHIDDLITGLTDNEGLKDIVNSKDTKSLIDLVNPPKVTNFEQCDLNEDSYTFKGRTTYSIETGKVLSKPSTCFYEGEIYKENL